MCGLPPYTADRLIDVSVIDGEVEIRLAEYFERPLRLTPAEGFALLAAGRALLAVPGSDTDGPLATALDKLDGTLGGRGGIAVDVGASDQVERLQDAAAADERVEIDYFSFARDEMTTRVIDPWRVFHAFGAWYVAAWCHRAEAERLFRVDRVRAVRDTGEHFDPASRTTDDVRDLVYRPRPDDPRVTLVLAPSAEWVVESHPHESVGTAPGRHPRGRPRRQRDRVVGTAPASRSGPTPGSRPPPGSRTSAPPPRPGSGGATSIPERPRPDPGRGSARMGSWSNLGDRRRRSPHRRRDPADRDRERLDRRDPDGGQWKRRRARPSRTVPTAPRVTGRRER